MTKRAVVGREAAAVGAIVGIGLGLALLVLWVSGARSGVDYVWPGADGPSAGVIRADFGAGRVRAGQTGYDGQQVYAIARDFPHLDRAATQLDAPRYRLLRILLPAVASVARRGSATVAAILALNVLGVAMACAALAALGARQGLPRWIGVAAALPLIPGVLLGTVEPLAFGLAFIGLVAADAHRHALAAAALTASALTRETAAVFALAVAVGLLIAGRRPKRPTSIAPIAPARFALYALPALAVVTWYLALGRIVGGALPDRTDVLSFASMGWRTISLVVGVVALCTYGAWWWRRAPAVWPAAAVLAVWTLFYFAGTFDWVALIRVDAVGSALGLAPALGAAAVRCRLPSRRQETTWHRRRPPSAK